MMDHKSIYTLGMKSIQQLTLQSVNLNFYYFLSWKVWNDLCGSNYFILILTLEQREEMHRNSNLNKPTGTNLNLL